MRDIDFLILDTTTLAVTPHLCEAALAFAENGPDEHDYNTFTDLRASLEKAFNNPYDLERFDDETGKGYTAGISHHRTPTDEAWELVGAYLKHNGFVHFEWRFTGIFKTVQTIGKITVDRSEGNTYVIKLYTEVK